MRLALGFTQLPVVHKALLQDQRTSRPPIISLEAGVVDGEGWCALPQDHSPDARIIFAGTALSSGSPAEGLRTANPVRVTNESDARWRYTGEPLDTALNPDYSQEKTSRPKAIRTV